MLEALSLLEEAREISPPIGAGRLPPRARFRQILDFLRGTICPKADEIIKKSESKGGDLAAVVFDVLVSVFTGIPAPCATISKKIAEIGLEKFCINPTKIVD